MRSRFAVALVPLFAACAVAHPPQPTGAVAQIDWRSLVGCYSSAKFRFALDSVAPDGHFHMGRDDPSAHRARSSTQIVSPDDTFWRVLPPKTIGAPSTVELFTGNPLYGTRVVFTVRGDSLIGNREALVDWTPSKRRLWPVTAHREPCQGEPGAADLRLIPDPRNGVRQHRP